MDGRCKIFTALLLLSHALANAQEPAREDNVRVTVPARPAIGIIVLVDNQVIKGRCTPRPDGYDVEVSSGRLFVESDRIRFVAKDPDDAYLQMRRSQGMLTPEVHMNLARWCLSNNMKEYAELEVLDALRRDPNRADARRMLAALKRTNETDPESPSGFTEYSKPKRTTVDMESRSLAGLARPIATEFTRHVQPILINKCATAGCHGVNAESTFQLTSTARGSSPVISERNLASVLKQVDLTRPSSSPLLLVLEKAHGGQAASMFRSRAGSLQMKVLRDWVQAVANDIAPEANLEVAERKAALDEARRKSLIAAAREASDRPAHLAGYQKTVESEPIDGNPHGRIRSREETDQEFLEDAERANANDAFSPSAFNKKYHGRTVPVDVEESEAEAIPEEADGSLDPVE
jgi:hypothetical protein